MPKFGIPHFSSPAFTGPPAYEIFQTSPLHCGEPVNETMYDSLLGIAKRKTHPLLEEPQVSMIFKKNEVDQLDLNEIEKNLRSSLQEVYIRYLVF